MTRILSGTRERFLLAIAGHVPADRIAEIHFFQGMKQGGIESGVAVVAATLMPAPPSPAVDEPDWSPDGGAPAQAGRFTVFTAHYRLTLKGADRGKWETTVVEEGDAPLVTVETVVRGVQRRSGDVEEAERIDGAEIRDILTGVAGRGSVAGQRRTKTAASPSLV